MHARFRSRPALLALGLAACRPGAAPTTAASENAAAAQPRAAAAPPAAWAPLPSTIRWPAGALAIALPPGEPAPWLLPSFEPGHDHPLDRLTVVASGEHIALARSGALLVATERQQGLLGTITLPPDVVWIGMGGGDRIFAADAGGRVLTAATVAEALEHGLAPTGAWLDAVATWDAAGEWLVAAVGPEVMVSDDGGRSFRPTKPAKGVWLVSAVVRADGVMVALVELDRRTSVHVSSDGGRSWRRSSWHPQSVWREGAWIMGWDDDVTGVLASDGRSWAGGLDRTAALEGYRSWDSDFFTGSLDPGTGPWPTPTDPPAPQPPERPLRGRARVDPGGALGGILGGGGIGFSGTGTACGAGIVCLHGSVGDAPPPSRLDVRVFGDARCETDAASCPHEHRRAPHMGVFDHAAGTLRLGRMPRSCTQVDVEVAAARGLGLVSCRQQDSTSLFAVEPDGTAHLELEVSHARPDVTYVMMAEDGTVLVPEIPTCEQWARAWVRRPLAAGRPDAWTQVAVPGARTWRPLGRGYALALADQPGGEGLHAALWLAGPEREPTPLLEGIPVLVGVTDVRVDDGRVSLHADRWLVVRHDGSLAPVELPSRERVVNGVTVVRARPWLGCGKTPMHLQ